MFSDMFGGGNDIMDILNIKVPNLFTTTDVKSILGRNVALNFIAKIDMELKMCGFSETSMQLIEFYSECAKDSNYLTFLNNPVVKFIKDNMNKSSIVKNYLNERLFDLVEDDIRRYYTDLLKHNEQKVDKIKEQEQKYEYKKLVANKKNSKSPKKSDKTSAIDTRTSSQTEVSTRVAENIDNNLNTLLDMLQDDLQNKKESIDIDLTDEPTEDSIDSDNNGFWSE